MYLNAARFARVCHCHAWAGNVNSGLDKPLQILGLLLLPNRPGAETNDNYKAPEKDRHGKTVTGGILSSAERTQPYRVSAHPPESCLLSPYCFRPVTGSWSGCASNAPEKQRQGGERGYSDRHGSEHRTMWCGGRWTGETVFGNLETRPTIFRVHAPYFI